MPLVFSRSLDKYFLFLNFKQIDVPEGIDNGEIIYLNGWVNDILY